ncbi:19908_t:CDS:2 [Dentiscutata erythropus]|uniref:19908_t:CDS:1 n=1 Tax=Dentiscutata erythropus TaxID=1348616 RepID=A0A9N9GCT1_9GLOM|nr:19908_t:CDS:2 [Dentiscutata erythropus]
MTTSTQKEINILLLGETGVGKSTFINALRNYLKFKTLDEALYGEMELLIPSKFVITNEDYEETTIELGDDSNENFENVGMSATQSCREYNFNYDSNTIVRFIDSPGIGDTRGIDKDKENLENILKFIRNYDYLNGICILLKPNIPRLTVLFKFCIQELLSHLHKSAKDNIVFCFADCRGTLYRPGQTIQPLKEQLKILKQRSSVEIKTNKETMYCFDNESFRFLAASKNKVHFDDMDRENFAESWKRSVAESVRLLQHLGFRNPHKVQDTLTLNDARNVVLNLARPLAVMQQNIQTNVKMVEDHQNVIDNCIEFIQELKKRLYIPRQFLEPKQQDIPESESSIKGCKQRLKQLESEQKKITEINICFAKFLSQNAIVIFNDSYAEYLEHFIHEEKIKKSADPANYNNEILEGLERTKKEYLEKIRIIKEAIETSYSSEDKITTEHIERYEKELYLILFENQWVNLLKYTQISI